jgi:hypothetical protein
MLTIKFKLMPLVNDEITNPRFWFCDKIMILGLHQYNDKWQNVALAISEEKSP